MIPALQIGLLIYNAYGCKTAFNGSAAALLLYYHQRQHHVGFRFTNPATRCYSTISLSDLLNDFGVHGRFCGRAKDHVVSSVAITPNMNLTAQPFKIITQTWFLDAAAQAP